MYAYIDTHTHTHTHTWNTDSLEQPVHVYTVIIEGEEERSAWRAECRGFESHPGQLLFPLKKVLSKDVLVGVAMHLPCTP